MNTLLMHEENLPCCGAELRHAVLMNGRSPDEAAKASMTLDFWIHSRLARHECALVTEANPMGLRPKVAP